MKTPITRTMTAKKTHTCTGCRQPINPGETYDREAIPPWLDYEGDVDDDGRPVAYLRDHDDRHWYTTRWHPTCYDRARYGY